MYKLRWFRTEKIDDLNSFCNHNRNKTAQSSLHRLSFAHHCLSPSCCILSYFRAKMQMSWPRAIHLPPPTPLKAPVRVETLVKRSGPIKKWRPRSAVSNPLCAQQRVYLLKNDMWPNGTARLRTCEPPPFPFAFFLIRKDSGVREHLLKTKMLSWTVFRCSIKQSDKLVKDGVPIQKITWVIFAIYTGKQIFQD